MFHYLMGALILICVTLTFNHQYQMRGALNAYYGLYKGIIETSVIGYDETGEKIYPYFDTDYLADRLTTYFQENLQPYCRSYLTNIRFSVYHTPKHPSKVEINLTITFNDISSMDRKAIFEIRSNINNE